MVCYSVLTALSCLFETNTGNDKFGLICLVSSPFSHVFTALCLH